MSTADTAAAGPELRFEELCVSRGGRRVLHGVSLAIPPGEITTLLGPNGAGKSSLVLAVGGVLRVSSGRVLLGERDLTRRRPEHVRGAGVAIVPEGRRLLPGLTVEDNLRVATYALSKEDAKSGIARALELFPELEKRWQITCRLLSGGEQQMVVLAQALVSARDPRRRAVARARPSGRQAPRARAPGHRRDRRRHSPDRAVRACRARAREQGLCAGGRSHPLRGDGQGADRAARFRRRPG